jgi:esterase
MKLYYQTFGEGGTPLIILHGLLGTSDNWLTIAKSLSDDRQVVIADARNHGQSPHSHEIDYDLMAADAVALVDKLGFTGACILGHSMGGKTAMCLALNHPGRVEKLVVADIAPKRYAGDHKEVFKAMMSAPVGEMDSRKAVEEHLALAIPSKPVRLFVMKNLGRTEAGNFFWKPNLNSLWHHYETLLGFPTVFEGATYTGPALFIRGQLSNYITPSDEPEIRKLFPAAQFISIPDAGHWLHAEQPLAFTNAVRGFLK